MKTKEKKVRRNPKGVIDVWRVKDQDGISFYDDDFTDVVDILKNMKDGSEFSIRKEKIKKKDFENAPDFEEGIPMEEDYFIPDYFWDESR